MAMPEKTLLYNELKLAREMGMPIHELGEKAYVSWTIPELKALKDRWIPDTVTAPEPLREPEPEAPRTRPEPVPAPAIIGHATPPPAPGVPPQDTWGQYAPQTLAALLGVPFNDRGADRAGLTFNSHGPDDPLRVDSHGRVWFRDEVLKPAIPKARMRRRVETVSNNVETVNTYHPDGRLNETFEVAGQEEHTVVTKVTLPSSQVGVYRDPRMPFKIHQYNGVRGFDHDAVRDFYGGLDLIPTSVKDGTIYVDSDLCFDINKVRDAIERELREKALGRSNF